ncbi:MAG: hypothetical protein ACRCUE_11610 [Bosea sp. (in: a-proteobacteria)]
MRRWRSWLRWTACPVWLAASAALAPLVACEIEGAKPGAGHLLRLTEHGDLLLSDNSLGRLAGIRMLRPEPGQPDPVAARFEELTRPWRERGEVWTGPERPDRWGRQRVSLNLAGGKPDASLALHLVRNGFAITWAAELPPNCRIVYLQAEDAARRANVGRWTQMQHNALDAANGADVAARAGQVAVMSGRINHVGQTRRTTYLNFGARGVGASAELGVSTWRLLEGQGWTRDGLKGKIVRVRGVVMEGRPAKLLLGDASAIEFLN